MGADWTPGDAYRILAASPPSNLLAVTELVVSLHKFINIELHAQGWYAVRVSMQPNPHTKVVWPSVVISGDATDKPSNKYAAALDHEGASYRSRIFRVRYCYEEAPIGETVSFQLYISQLQLLDQFSCCLEIELLLHEADINLPDLEPASFQLRPVSKEVIRVSQLCTGVSAYHAATFDTHHFGLCHIGVFGMMRGLTTATVMEEMAATHSGRGERLRSSWSALIESQRNNWMCRRSCDVPRPSLAANSFDSPMLRNSSVTGGTQAPHLQGHSNDLAVRQAMQEVADAPVRMGNVLATASDAAKMDRVAFLYTVTTAVHQQGRLALAQFLRQLPQPCYAPQNFVTIRALLARGERDRAGVDVADPGGGTAPPAQRNLSATSALTGTPRLPSVLGTFSGAVLPATSFSSNASFLGTSERRAAGRRTTTAQHAHGSEGGAGGTGGRPTTEEASTSEVAAWPEFYASLPQGCSPGAALLHLESVLQRLRHDSNLDWAVLLWVLRQSPRELHQMLKTAWELDQPGRLAPWLALDHRMPESLCDARTAAAAAFRHRLRNPSCVHHPPRLAPTAFWDHPAEQPVLFVDASLASGWSQGAAAKEFGAQQPQEETHVVVFVHGFQGAASDLCLLKGHLTLMFPYLDCFSSKVNEGNTHDAIQDMGARLAQELVDHLSPFTHSNRRPLKRLSFVGHSIGNLILRAALATPSMAPFLPLLWMYISISGPHLGFLYSTNTMLDTGMRVLKSIGRGKCLHQLSFTDASNQRDCYLYKLSQEGPGLSAFRHVILVFSPQDRYVPFHSARISMCDAAAKDGKRGAVYKEITDALLNNVGGPGQTQLLRVDVDFDLAHKAFSFSKMVGRTAHIEFIESDTYIRFLMWGVVHKHCLLQPSTNAWL